MAFVSRFGLYKFTVLLFGLCYAPSTFKCLMNYVFSDLIDWYVLVYFDDILVYSETANDHEKHLCKVFSQLCAHKLQVKHAKCEFGHAYVHYLGHIVGSGKLQVDIEKVATVKDWPTPSCIRDI